MLRLSLNRNQLKYLVIIAMIIDHIATAFLPDESILAMIMHFVGRFTAPTMAYFIVEGYYHTKSVKKYVIRLAVFAAVSWLPFSYFETGTLTLRFSVLYTLLLGLFAVWFLDTANCSTLLKIVGIFVILILSAFGDWLMFVPLWCVSFYGYHKAHSKKEKMIPCMAYIIISILYCKVIIESETWYHSWWSLGVFVAPLFLIAYNGKSGSKNVFHKWFFYLFYPVHLVILYLIK